MGEELEELNEEQTPVTTNDQPRLSPTIIKYGALAFVITIGVLLLIGSISGVLPFGNLIAPGNTAETSATATETNPTSVEGELALPTPFSETVPADTPANGSAAVTVAGNRPTCQANKAATGWMYVYSQPNNRFFQGSIPFIIGRLDHKLKDTLALYGEVVRSGQVTGKAWFCQAWNNRFQIMSVSP